MVIVGEAHEETLAYLADGAKAWSTKRVKEDSEGRRFITIKGERIGVETFLQGPDSHVFTVAEAEAIRLYVKCIERAYGASIKDGATCERCMLGLENHLAGAHSEAESIDDVDLVYASLFDILLSDYYERPWGVLGLGRHSDGLVRAFQAVLRKTGGFGHQGELQIKTHIETYRGTR